MKKSIQSLVAVAAIAFSAVTTHAQSAPKILVVDLAKLFDTHWKTQEQTAKLQEDEKKAQDQLAVITKDGNALVEQFKELDEQSKNPAATAEAKAKAQTDAQKKYDEIQQKRSEQNSFVQNTGNTLKQRFQTFKTLMIEEITKSAVEIAKKHGLIDSYLVLVRMDSGGKGANVMLVTHFPSLSALEPDKARDQAMMQENLAVLSKEKGVALTNGFDKYRTFVRDGYWQVMDMGK